MWLESAYRLYYGLQQLFYLHSPLKFSTGDLIHITHVRNSSRCFLRSYGLMDIFDDFMTEAAMTQQSPMGCDLFFSHTKVKWVWREQDHDTAKAFRYGLSPFLSFWLIRSRLHVDTNIFYNTLAHVTCISCRESHPYSGTKMCTKLWPERYRFRVKIEKNWALLYW